MTNVHIKSEYWETDRHAQKEDNGKTQWECHMKVEVEIGIMLSQTKGI